MRVSQIYSLVFGVLGSSDASFEDSPVSVMDLSLEQDKVIFIIIGDSGEAGDAICATGAAVQALGSETDISFIGVVGDLVYPAGIESPDDERLLAQYPQSFAGVFAPFNPVLGDNDYGKTGQSSRLSAFVHASGIVPGWEMPALYYSKIYRTGSVSVCSIFLDTQSMISVLFPEERLAEEITFLEAQMDWLEESLSSFDCRVSNFIVVFGHHSIFSTSRKGNKGEAPEIMRSKLLPILDRHKVDAYFAGHDHDLQLVTDHSSGIAFVISGASSRIREKIKNIELENVTSWAVKDVIGFVVSEARESEMKIKFVDSQTREPIFSYVVRSRREYRTPDLLAKGVQ
jgi:tartrate-resistant acid phosphatase type 5